MFSRRVFGGQPDSYKLVLEYGREAPQSHVYRRTSNPGEGSSNTTTSGGAPPFLSSDAGQVRLPVALATLEFEFNSDEPESTVVERFAQRTSSIAFDRLEEHVVVTVHVLAAAPPGAPLVRVQLQVAAMKPALRCLQVVRTSSSGNVPEPVLAAILKHCDLGGVWKLRGADGFGHFWASCCEVSSWHSLRNMNLGHCGLASLPHAIGQLVSLRILRLSHNRLTALPPDLSRLTQLEVLSADHNQLTSVPVELRHCSALRDVNLEGNRLAAPVLDLRALHGLISLQLYGNPLDYLPELSPATALRSLSLANVRIMADASYSRWEVEVAALPYMSRGHKLAPLFRLTFRRSSCQHPLLAGALGRISEDRANCELIAKEETAMQQLVLMALSEQPVVSVQACKTLNALAQLGAATAKRLLGHDISSLLSSLLRSQRRESQLCGLQLLSALSAGSDAVSSELLTMELLATLHERLVPDAPGADATVRCAALEALAHAAFCRENKVKIRSAPRLLQTLMELAGEAPPAAEGEAADGGQALHHGARVEEVRGGVHARPSAVSAGGAASLSIAGRRTEEGLTVQTTFGSPLRSCSVPNIAATQQQSESPSPAAAGAAAQQAAAAAAQAAPTPPVKSNSSLSSSMLAAAARVLSPSRSARASPAPASAQPAAATSKSAAASAAAVVVPAAGGSVGGARASFTATAAAADGSSSAAAVAAVGLATAVGSPGAPAAAPPPAAGASNNSMSMLPPIIANAAPRAVPTIVAAQDRTKLLAIRILAILGENDHVSRAIGMHGVHGRGLRVLAMDGGGMKGLIMVQMLRHMQRRTGRPLHELFDLVVGTSTGAILAISMAMLHFDLDQCEAVYTGLGHKVFNQSGASAKQEEQVAAQAAVAQQQQQTVGWRDSLYRVVRGTGAGIRFSVYGSKHDASTFEMLLQQMCDTMRLGCVSNQLIDTAVLGGPKVAVVATIVSTSPAAPFLFTNYELPPEAQQRAAALHACPSSSKHMVWQAVRASSAAPYYLEDFGCGDERWQDGAVIANNPSVLALQQARLLWPDVPLDALVSLGCGIGPPVRRERSMHSMFDTGSVLIEAATSSDRADEALSALAPLVPGLKYYRFNPVDERCNMDLDDVDPAHWAAVQACAEEYCCAHAARFDELVELLETGLPGVHDGAAAAGASEEEEEEPSGVAAIRLGSRRGVVVVEAPCGLTAEDWAPEERVAHALGHVHGTMRCFDLGAASASAAASAAATAEHLELQDREQQQLQQQQQAEGEILLDELDEAADAAAAAAGPQQQQRRAAQPAPHQQPLQEQPAQLGSFQQQLTPPSQQQVLQHGPPAQGPALAMVAPQQQVVENATSLGNPPNDVHLSPAADALLSPRSLTQLARGPPVPHQQWRRLSGGAAAPPLHAAGVLQPPQQALHEEDEQQLQTPAPAPQPLQHHLLAPGMAAADLGRAAATAAGGHHQAPAPPSAVADAAAEAAAAAATAGTSPVSSSLFDYFFGAPSAARRHATSSSGAEATAAAGAKPPMAFDKRLNLSVSTPPGFTGGILGLPPLDPAIGRDEVQEEEPLLGESEPSLTSPSQRHIAATSSITLSVPSALVARTGSSPHSSTPSAGGPAATAGAAAGAGRAAPASCALQAPAAAMASVAAGSSAAAMVLGPVPHVHSLATLALSLLQGLLQDLQETCGLLHLGMRVVPGDAGAGAAAGLPGQQSPSSSGSSSGGLVLSWQRDVVALVEPGPEAAAIVRGLGHDPSAASLSGLFAASPRPSLDLPQGGLLTLLGRQEVRLAGGAGGQPVASLLLQVSRPACVLLPEHLLPNTVPEWSGLIVTAASPLPPALVGALLRCGVSAIVSPEAPILGTAAATATASGDGAASTAAGALNTINDTASVDLPVGSCGGGAGTGGQQQSGEREVVGFFRALVEALAGGEPVMVAIQAAERRHPRLQGKLACHHL